MICYLPQVASFHLSVVIIYYTEHCLLSKITTIKKWCDYCLFNRSEKVWLKVIIDSGFHFFSQPLQNCPIMRKSSLALLALLHVNLLCWQKIYSYQKNRFLTCFWAEMKVNVFCECWVLVVKKSSGNLSWLKFFNRLFALSLGFWKLVHVLWDLLVVHSRPSQRFKIVKVHQAET